MYNIEKESDTSKRLFLWHLLFVSMKNLGNREYDLDPWVVCVCARVWATCSHYARQVFLMLVHSLTFAVVKDLSWYRRKPEPPTAYGNFEGRVFFGVKSLFYHF